jgi:hypothetical protein
MLSSKQVWHKSAAEVCSAKIRCSPFLIPQNSADFSRCTVCHQAHLVKSGVCRRERTKDKTEWVGRQHSESRSMYGSLNLANFPTDFTSSSLGSPKRARSTSCEYICCKMLCDTHSSQSSNCQSDKRTTQLSRRWPLRNRGIFMHKTLPILL